MKDTKLIVGTIIWGRGHHIRVFPKCIASIVAAIRYSEFKIKVIIFTDNREFCKNVCEQYKDVEFIFRECIGKKEKICFERLRLNQQSLINFSNTWDIPFSYIAPDQIISENTFQFCMEMYCKGYAYVLFPSLRVKFETCFPCLRDDGKYSGRDIAELFFKHIHPIQSAIDYDKFNRDFFPSEPWGLMKFFPEIKGAIMKPIHGCTMLVKPQTFKPLSPLQAIDCQYVEDGILDFKKVYVIKNCDECATIDLSPSTRLIPYFRKGKSRKWKLFKYLRTFGCSFNMRTPLSNTLIYTESLTQKVLEKYAQEFDREINHIFVFSYFTRFFFKFEKINPKAILIFVLDWLSRKCSLTSYLEKKLK